MRTHSLPSPSHRLGNPAFAVIDLLLAVIFFATMASLVVIAVLASRTAAARAACQDNLRQIRTAYHGFIAARNGKSSEFVRTFTWVDLLVNDQLNGSDSVFVCPSDDTPRSVGKWVLPNAKIALMETWQDENPPVIPLAVDGTRCRLSIGKITVTPPSFALEIERDRDDFLWDWDDLIMRVDPHPDGSITITAIRQDPAPYCYNILSPDGDVLVLRFSSSGNTTYTFPASAHKHYSYGVNGLATYFSPQGDANKVLALDYKKRVCDLVVFSADWPRKFALDYWPSNAAPRHGGSLNVLFQDGHVKSMAPKELDPRLGPLRLEYWVPESLREELADKWR